MLGKSPHVGLVRLLCTIFLTLILFKSHRHQPLEQEELALERLIATLFYYIIICGTIAHHGVLCLELF